MSCIKNLKKFPCIYQIHEYWCIPASIENVIRYHGGNLSQRQIVNFFVKKYPFHLICFEKIKEVLDEDYGKKFSYEVNHHKDANTLLNYVENKIGKNLPIIVSVHPAGGNPHMLAILCVDGEDIRIFDTGRSHVGTFIKNRKEIINILAPGLGTFTICPKSFLSRIFT